MYRDKIFATVLLVASASGAGVSTTQSVPSSFVPHAAFIQSIPQKSHGKNVANRVKSAETFISVYLKGRKWHSLPTTLRRGTTIVTVANMVPILRQFGVRDYWLADQHTWQIAPLSKAATKGKATATSSTEQTPTDHAGSTSPNTMINMFNTNNHTNDQTDWQTFNPNLYVSAQTDDPSTSNANMTSLLTASPNQTLYLFAFSDQMNVKYQDVTWRVNSPDATVTTVNEPWQMGNYQTTEATFVATKPGIYTVQAVVNGSDSVPLVLTVGINQLQYTPFASTARQTGIMPLPTGLPRQSPTTQGGVSYYVYPAKRNWIPVSGSTQLPINAMNVVISGSGSQEWTYRLPIINRHFSGLLEAPFPGSLTVTLFPNYFKTLSQATQNSSDKYYMPLSNYEVRVSGQRLNRTTTALLASAQRDYNMSPKFAQTASTLLENSPTMDTAIAAIANYASDSLIYKQQELQTENYLWQDSWSAWQSGKGVCEDYASLAAALLDAVAIPTQTVGGRANSDWTTTPSVDNNPGDVHEWNQAWDGTRWVPFDATWNTDDQASVAHSITNQYFGATTSMMATHLADPSQTGKDY